MDAWGTLDIVPSVIVRDRGAAFIDRGSWQVIGIYVVFLGV